MATSYDYEINSYLSSAAAGYNAGDYATVEDAIIYIKEQAAAKYSDIVVE